MGKPSLNYQLHKALEATGIDYSKTCKQYMRDIEKYGDFCKREYGCRNAKDCMNPEYAQHYADYLHENGYAASTIHTYLAPV